MKALCRSFFLRCTFPWMLIAVLFLGSQGVSVHAAPPRSRVPVFGNAGWEFSKQAKSSHEIRGWLPQGWLDNSSWAALSATYTRLTDSPDAEVSAVRIKLESLDNGQLQLTSWQGEYEYLKGKKYAVTGWVRSPNQSIIKVGAREHEAPHAFYAQGDLTPTAEWERFEFVFEPEMDCDAWIMFCHDETRHRGSGRPGRNGEGIRQRHPLSLCRTVSSGTDDGNRKSG